MPLILEGNYSKKIGLPHYSSHQFMMTLRTEITDLGTVQAESDRLYDILQTAVDASLQKVGYLPSPAAKNGNGSGNGNSPDRWQCSDKQRDLILKIPATASNPNLALYQSNSIQTSHTCHFTI
jgi:hypothetical protein